MIIAPAALVFMKGIGESTHVCCAFTLAIVASKMTRAVEKDTIIYKSIIQFCNRTVW